MASYARTKGVYYQNLLLYLRCCGQTEPSEVFRSRCTINRHCLLDYKSEGTGSVSVRVTGVRRDVKISALVFRKVLNLRGHHMENVLVQNEHFPTAYNDV
jgi:hypothetical protein